MRAYIVCPHRKSNPKVAVEVCRACRRRKTCRRYHAYLNPPLFSEHHPPVGSTPS
ncbi:MAG TPA: hypothetical protein PLS81_01125 [Deltaproteobacteria bacterium]|nr:hypothetical protein [Deltaproteobacteria bacterium]HOM28044.1 hypothetical protein [Deltaproteobacteria bacterium]HPP80385.1 hypothetical protein [Deltaproteobacteria bacterium]